MFDGLPSDHEFHQFIASRASLSLLSSFPLPGNPSFSSGFDPCPPSVQIQGIHHHQRHQEIPNSRTDIDGKHVENPLISTSLALERERSMVSWSSDEVLALLKLRSSMEISFPDFTWEHVSRKLAEYGFRRSAEECKAKFAEEGKHFDSVTYNRSYKTFSELDELYPSDQEEARVSAERSRNVEKKNEAHVYKIVEKISGNKASNPGQESEGMVRRAAKSGTKRMRKDKFEKWRSFVEAAVNKMMAQQEELHNKLIEDIVRRDEEKIAREEAWKNQEMDRIKREIEKRAKEQARAEERQATIIEFLTAEAQHFPNKIADQVKISDAATLVVCDQNPTPLTPSQDNPKATKTPSPPSLGSSLARKESKASTSASVVMTNENPLAAARTPSSPPNSDSTTNYERGGDTGRRWPRDEVLALINLRCKLSSNNDDSKEGPKGPLWERISQGMLELGYKRSAKRCKEKWENINKYFRKTKDSNKKRSIGSRTCPYFHQLSCLYSEGTLQAPKDLQENQQKKQEDIQTAS